MPWSYDSNLKAEKDQVRFLIRDTNSAGQLFQDEEIKWMIANEQNIYMAAAQLCDNLVVKAGNVRSKKISEFSITYDSHFYKSLAGSLRARGCNYQTPYAGGISMADKLAVQQDSDWVTPAISRDLDRNPTAPTPQTPPSNPLTSL